MAWYFIYSFFILAQKKSNNCQISIIATCVNRTKVNLDVVNAYNNVWKMFWTWKKLCYWFFKTFYMIKLVSMVFNQFIHGTHYLCIFLDIIDQYNFLLHFNPNPWWPLGVLFSHSWHRTWNLLMIVLCFCVW